MVSEWQADLQTEKNGNYKYHFVVPEQTKDICYILADSHRARERTDQDL